MTESATEINDVFISNYELLKSYGHSPQKAAEIALDAQRSDKHAAQWLTYIRSTQQQTKNYIDKKPV